MSQPLLVFGWGNRSRGDDALGPMCVEQLRALYGGSGRVEFLDDYQLMIEHALDLVGRSRVLLVDASLEGRAPFETRTVRAARGGGPSSHALPPEALLQVYCDVRREAPPPCTLLAIRGERFELGMPPSAPALRHLQAAVSWAQAWLAVPQPLPLSA
jgi:hydrogenase maturation protease